MLSDDDDLEGDMAELLALDVGDAVTHKKKPGSEKDNGLTPKLHKKDSSDDQSYEKGSFDEESDAETNQHSIPQKAPSPPTASTRKFQSDNMFNDDDEMPDFGLDDGAASKQTKTAVSNSKTESGINDPKIMDLFGTKVETKPEKVDKPATREFVLAPKYKNPSKQKGAQQPSRKQDDLSFGGYTPSTSVGGDKKAVRFDTSGSDDSGETDDWLGIAISKKKKEKASKTSRPAEKSTDEWIFSGAKDASDREFSSRKRIVDDNTPNDDFLGLSASDNKKKENKTKSSALDWLLGNESKPSSSPKEAAVVTSSPRKRESRHHKTNDSGDAGLDFNFSTEKAPGEYDEVHDSPVNLHDDKSVPKSQIIQESKTLLKKKEEPSVLNGKSVSETTYLSPYPTESPAQLLENQVTQDQYTGSNVQQTPVHPGLTAPTIYAVTSPSQPNLNIASYSEPHSHQAAVQFQPVVDYRGIAQVNTQEAELQMEKIQLKVQVEGLQAKLETVMKQQRNDESSWFQQMEEFYKNSLERLREENSKLGEELITKEQHWHHERDDLVKEWRNKLNSSANENNKEVENLKSHYRKQLDSLEGEHRNSLEQLKRIKDAQIEAAASGLRFSEPLANAVKQLSENTEVLLNLSRSLSSVQSSISDSQSSSSSALSRFLQVAEDKLLRQHEDSDRENAKLQEMLTRLEYQMREYSSVNDKDRWALKQEQTRLATLQNVVDKQRQDLDERLDREYKAIQQAKDKFTEEQKEAFTELLTERKALSIEREKLTAQKATMQQKHELSTMQLEVDLESRLRSADEQRRLLDEEKEQLKKNITKFEQDRQQIQVEKETLGNERRSLFEEQERFKAMALTLKTRSEQVEKLASTAAKIKTDGESRLTEAQRRDVETKDALNTLEEQQKVITQERLALERERRCLEQMRRERILCSNCTTPVKDTNLKTAAYKPLLNSTAISEKSRTMPDESIVQQWLSGWKNQEDGYLKAEEQFLESIKYL